MIELDPELKEQILEFIRERERVTAQDVREEFFPGDITRPYLYLDRLTVEGRLGAVPGQGCEPSVWLPYVTPREAAKTRAAHRKTAVDQVIRAGKKRQSRNAARREASSHAGCDHPISRAAFQECRRERQKKARAERAKERQRVALERQAEISTRKTQPAIDPELLAWVRDFVRQRETVSVDDLVQDFFPGDPHRARLYLSAIEPEQRETQRKDPHADCVHPDTPQEKKRCHSGWYVPGTMERMPSAAQILKSVRLKTDPKPMQVMRPRSNPAVTKARVLEWIKRQTELHRTGHIGCLPTTTDTARALFSQGATATVGKDGIVTSGGVVRGNAVIANRYLTLLESEGLVQRHKMTHGIPMVFWSAVDNPTGAPVPPGVLDYYS